MKPFAHHLHRVANATTQATVLPSDRATPLMAAGTSTQKLEGIQACRGAAALLVLLFHVTQLTQEKLGQPFVFNLFAFGSAGVDFFFVLSGFILFFVHSGDLGRRDRLKPFMLKRLIRVYPLYWLLTLVILPIYFVVPQFGYGYERDFWVIIKSLLLIPQDHFPILIVGWSLCHEILFYGMFALAMLLPIKRSMSMIGSWLLGTAALLLYNSVGFKLEGNFLVQFVFSAHNLEFLLGCVAAYLVLQHWLKAQRLFFLMLGVSLFFVFGWSQAERGLESNFLVAYGVPSALIVFGVASMDVVRSRPLPRLFSYLGDASYSIYLTHYPCLSLLLKLILAAKLTERVGYPLSVSLLLLTTLLLGGLTYTFLEKPLVNVLRKMLVNPKLTKPTVKLVSTKAMNILFLDQSGALAGAELCLLDVVQSYRDRCLVCLFTDGPFKTALEKQGISVQVMAAQPLAVKKESGLIQGLRSLGQLLPLAMTIAQVSRTYDLIYANTQKALVVGALASFISRRPLVYHLHDILSADHFSATNRRLAVTLANRFASRVIATSHATKAAFVAAGGRADLATVVYNGFESTVYRYSDRNSTTQLRQQLGLEGQFVVGHFSRLSPWKGQHILIEALLHCPPDVIAIFVGDALFGEQDYVQTLNAQVQTLGLQNRVHFLGFRTDVVPLMQLCDVVAHTSTAPEPFGRVIAEAMLCGRPVIAAASGGAVELVEPGVTGWLVPPGDPHSLAAAIAHCRAHAETTNAIAQTAQTSATQRFNLSHIQQQIDQLLQAVIHC